MISDLNQPENAINQLWLASVNTDIAKDAADILDTQAFTRYQRMGSSKAQLQYLSARWLAKHALSAFNPEITWHLTPEGPPSVITPADTGIHISFSHTETHVAFALSNQGRIGCDIETDRPRKNFLKIATQFYTENESRYLHTLKEDEGLKRFYQFWTLKEASLKARHLTIAGHLNDIELSINYNKKLSIQHPFNQSTNALSYRFFENLHIAVCSNRVEQRPLEIFYLDEQEYFSPCDIQAENL